MQEFSTSDKFLYVVKNELTSPRSVGLWVLAAIAAYALKGGLWWLPIVVAGIVQAGLVFRTLHDEETLRKLFMARQERQETLTEQQIEALLERMDFESRQRIRYILQLQKEIAREARADDVEAYSRKDLDRIASNLSPLVQRAVQLAQKRQRLSKYLQNVDERLLQNYVTKLQQRIQTLTDPVQKTQSEQALRARETELQTYKEISQASARIDSQLENVEATFASWKAKVIRIKTADAAGAASVRDGLYQELDSLSNEIDLLDSSVSEALEAEEELTLKQQS